MNDERGDAPKDEGAQGQAAPKSKEKRVAPYFLPNLVVAALVAITASGYPPAILAASLSLVGLLLGTVSMLAVADGNYRRAARSALVARLLFWFNFLGLAAFAFLSVCPL